MNKSLYFVAAANLFVVLVIILFLLPISPVLAFLAAVAGAVETWWLLKK